MKFKSFLAVSLLLFSEKMSDREVQAFRFPSELSLDEKKTFINKVGKLEKRFNSGKQMRDTVQTINSAVVKPEKKKEKHHGPIVQEHSNNFNGNSPSGGLIRDSIYARYFNLQFDYQNAQDFVAGFSYQVFNDLFLYNAEDCTFWSFDTFSDMINSFLLLVEDNKPDESILSFGYSIHKGPVAYYTCTPVIDDYQTIVNFYTEVTKTPDQWGSLVVKIFWNVFFNWADIYYEFRSFENEFEKRNWTMTGTSLAKMFTDICFKAPIDESWNYKNSDVINDEWGEPPNLRQGLNDFWIWLGQESFLAEQDLQTDEERIKDAGDLDFDNAEPNNVNIFDGDKTSDDTGGITIKDGKDDDKTTDDSQSKTDDKDDGISIDDGDDPSAKPKVKSSKMVMDNGFNELLKKQIQESMDQPLAHFMTAQMLQEDPDELQIKTEKVKRLAKCVRQKGARNKELKRQATAIFKILNHLKNKQSYMRVEPLLDFTLAQYHCV